jgi:two-component system, OmpR family, sensor histidine kinase MprB
MREAAVLSGLVAEVLDLARGELEPEPPIETDVTALVERAVARTRRVNPSVMVEVRGNVPERLVRPVALERAVANLVRNAVQVSDDGDHVEVVLDEADGWMVVQVLDRGPGIAEEDLPRIFDRFYRGDSARERQGSGLGLAIVAQPAEQQGGTVTAANRSSGGAVFTLRIPLHAADTAETPE